ncbi:MAG TPA: hypothetical protein VF730_11225, partial [Terracidiphilus sp.]
MNAISRLAIPPRYLCATAFIGLLFIPAISLNAQPPAGTAASQTAAAPICEPASLGSPYIPVD